MQVYFVKTDAYNAVAITNGETVKVFYAVPDGIFEGVDLYGDDAEKNLRETFTHLSDEGELNDFDEMSCDSRDEFSFQDFQDWENASLVFDDQSRL